MTGIPLSKARTHSSDLISHALALENRAAKIFQHSRWLNDLSLPLLLMLAASLANRPANAQQSAELNEVILTAQNQFGTVSQLIIRDGILYLLEDGCNLTQIRQLSDADIAAIQALSLLTVEEVGLHLQLVSYAPMGGADLSEFCVSSDPVSSFITSIRQDDSESSNFAGLLAGGLGLLLGLAGGGGGGIDTLIGGDGDDIFVMELADGLRAADFVSDFTDDKDKLALTLSQADKNTLNAVTDDAAKFTKLLELAMLRLEAGDSSNDATKNDVHVIYTGGTNDETVMVLDELLDGGALTDLTIADFQII